MLTWFRRLKDWEQLTIAILLGVGSVLSYRYLNDLAYANVQAECDQLSEIVDNLPENVSMSEFDRKLQEYNDCSRRFLGLD